MANTQATDKFQNQPLKPKTSEVISLKKKYSKTDEGSEEDGFAFGSSDNSMSNSSIKQQRIVRKVQDTLSSDSSDEFIKVN